MYFAGVGNTKTGRVETVNVNKVVSGRSNLVETSDTALITNRKWTKFWDLMDTIKVHGYVRAAMGVIGRSAVGTWWMISKHEEYRQNAKELHRKRLIEFYDFSRKNWDNIKDFYGMAYKIMIGVMYLRYFGFCAYQIIRDNAGNPIGLDFINGYVVPNVDAEGYFLTPAFIQYPVNSKDIKVEFDDPKDIVYIVNPDWEGYASGSSDIESLTDYTLPLDIYLQTAAREYIKNRNTPEAFYVLSADVSDEAFDSFVDALEAKYTGPLNVGRNPTVVQGELDIKTVSKIPSDLPYQSTRKDTRQETLAVSGVSGSKLGITEDMANANLRETRREFHETSMLPLFRFISTAFYEQIHVREFGYKGWMFTFNNPDFLTAVERATVDMRYYGIGVFNPNEIRQAKGMDSRKDELGDTYADQLKNAPTPDNQQGSPPEGRPVEPDAPSQTGEPTLDNQDPPRGDNHDDETRNNVLTELRRYKTFTTKRLGSGKKISRKFKSDILPEDFLEELGVRVSMLTNEQEAKALFEDLISYVEENY